MIAVCGTRGCARTALEHRPVFSPLALARDAAAGSARIGSTFSWQAHRHRKRSSFPPPCRADEAASWAVVEQIGHYRLGGRARSLGVGRQRAIVAGLAARRNGRHRRQTIERANASGRGEEASCARLLGWKKVPAAQHTRASMMTIRGFTFVSH